VVLALSWDEFQITFFTIGDQSTLPLVIWSRARLSIDPSVNAIGTLMVAGSLLVVIFTRRFIADSYSWTEAGAIVTGSSPGRVAMSAAADAQQRVAVRLDSVTKRFSTQVALHPLHLEVREGEFVTLLGPSGCGKTTLLADRRGPGNP